MEQRPKAVHKFLTKKKKEVSQLQGVNSSQDFFKMISIVDDTYSALTLQKEKDTLFTKKGKSASKLSKEQFWSLIGIQEKQYLLKNFIRN